MRFNKMMPKLGLSGDGFAKQALTLVTGTTAAQVVPIAITPILTRFYSPDDFGLLALFVSICMVFSVAANGRYELAIVLPEADHEAANITALSFIICIAAAAALAITAYAFNDEICRLLRNDAIAPWLYAVPLCVLFSGLFNSLNYYNTRLKQYGDIAKSNIYRSFTLGAGQLLGGILRAGEAGLIVSQTASHATSNIRLLRNFLNNGALAHINFTEIRRMAVRYQDFPKYSLASVLSNTLSFHLIGILISLHYSVVTLGLYALVQRILGIPTSIIGNSISQVFLQRASEEKRATGAAIKIYRKTTLNLALISVPAFTLLYFTAEPVFEFVFGAEWRIAGSYAKILTPLFAIRFVMSAVSNINNVFEKQKLALLWQVCLLLLTVATFSASQVIGLGFEDFLRILVFVTSAHYIALYILLSLVAKGKI